MPRFHFDVFDGREVLIDEHGDVFLDVEDAAAQATGLLTNFARENLPCGLSQDFGVAVRGEGGQDIYRAALIFRDAYIDRSRATGSRDLCRTLSVPSPVELIRQSRETRAESGTACRRVGNAMAGLTDVLRQAAEAMKLAQETVAAIR